MGLFSALRKSREQDEQEEMYENDYAEEYGYEDDAASVEEADIHPARATADMQVSIFAPKQYKDASTIADQLRAMKVVMLDLSELEADTARRLLDFVSGVVYAEDGSMRKVAKDIFIVTPYFVELIGDSFEETEE